MKHSTKKPTKIEQDRLDAIHAEPCYCCVIEKVQQPSPTEAHHVVDKGYRKHSGGHMATLNLCGWHHRGDVRGCQIHANPPTMANVEKAIGPSLQGNKKAFIARYGREREILAKVDAALSGEAAA